MSKESLKSPNTGKAPKKHAREVDTLKKIIGEYAVANEALAELCREKNAGRKQRMKHAAAETRKSISLARNP